MKAYQIECIPDYITTCNSTSQSKYLFSRIYSDQLISTFIKRNKINDVIGRLKHAIRLFFLYNDYEYDQCLLIIIYPSYPLPHLYITSLRIYHRNARIYVIIKLTQSSPLLGVESEKVRSAHNSKLRIQGVEEEDIRQI